MCNWSDSDANGNLNLLSSGLKIKLKNNNLRICLSIFSVCERRSQSRGFYTWSHGKMPGRTYGMSGTMLFLATEPHLTQLSTWGKDQKMVLLWQYVTLSAIRRLIEGHIAYALIRRRAWCAASDQGLRYVSIMSIYWKHCCRSLKSFSHKYGHEYVKTSDLV